MSEKGGRELGAFGGTGRKGKEAIGGEDSRWAASDRALPGPAPSRPGPAAHRMHRKRSVLPGQVRAAPHRPVAFRRDAGAASQSAARSAPPLREQPMTGCQGRKLFRPDGVSTDALEAAVAEPVALTGPVLPGK